MAKMKGPKEKLALLALKQAADDTDDAGPNMSKDEDSMTEELVCPHCGHKGPEDEFKEPA